MPGPIVVSKTATCTILFGSTLVDLGAHIIGVEPTEDVEVVDVRTFANPKGQDFGNQTDGLTLSLKWSPDLYAALAPYKNTEGALVFKYATTAPAGIRATIKYGAVPWGSFNLGEVVEVSLPCIVIGDITYT